MSLRSQLRVLALCLLIAGISGQQCPLMVAQQAAGPAGPPPPIQPLDRTKVIVSAGANPTLLIQSLAQSTLRVQAVVAFNSSLDTSSVRVHDITPGHTPAVLGSLDLVGITPNGQLFQGEIPVDGSAIGSIRLQVSAAYFGDPRRARSAAFDVPVVAQPVVALFNPLAVRQISSGSTVVVNRIVVDLVADVDESEATALAGDVGASIVGFDAVGNLYLFELPIDPDDPGAEAALETALAALRAESDLVERAFPNLVLSAETVDFDALGAADQSAFDAARIPDAWAELPGALTANGKLAPSAVEIGVIDTGLEAGNATGTIDPHPDLDFNCTNHIADATCPVRAPDPNDLIQIGVGLTNAHNASCNATCLAARAQIDHGTFVTGLIGAVNHDGRAATAALGTNGVLAFADGATGTAAQAAKTGSDLPYQIHFGRAVDYFTMNARITTLTGEGAQIVLLAFGWTKNTISCPSDPGANLISATDFDAATLALRDKIDDYPNVLFVASAGNCGADASNHTPGGMLLAPANLVSVGATDPDNNDAASFSNTGATVHVAAPGVGVPGPIGYKDQGAVLNANTTANTGAASAATADITTGTGTSASAALVAGVAGLHLAISGTIAPATLKARLLQSDVIAGSGLAGVPRLDALRVVQSTVATRTDLAVVVDTSGSFGNDIATFQTQAPSLLEELRNLGLDVAVSVADFQDFPVLPFGGTGDVPYRRVAIPDTDGGSDPVPTPLQETSSGGAVESNVNDVTSALAALAIGNGGDFPESQLEALRQIATGAGNATYTAPGQGGVQGAAGVVTPGFRSNSAARFIVLWTDASHHDPTNVPGYPGPSMATVCSELNARNIKVISVLAPGFFGDDPRPDAEALADCTDSCVPAGVAGVDCDGNGTNDLGPGARFICDIAADGTGIAEAIRNTVQAATSGPVSCGP
jgi:hypothetical protein